MNTVKTDHTFRILKSFPTIIEFVPVVRVEEFIAQYKEIEDQVNELLRDYGAVVFRGIGIDNATGFEKLMSEVFEEFIDYVDGNSPRTKLSSKVYTSTEYDPNFPITLHNELSYTTRWPSKLAFFCLNPAGTGGETPIADCRKIIEEIPVELRDQIKNKKIKYIRNLHSGQGIGPSWQDTFETDDKEVVERWGLENDSHMEWTSSDMLRISQIREGIITSKRTGNEVWFNQIDQFHPSHLEEEIYEMLMMVYKDKFNLPTYVCWGNDEPIDDQVVREIQQAIDKVKVLHSWKKRDLLLIDNELTAHGRMPFTGPRKILVSMTK